VKVPLILWSSNGLVAPRSSEALVQLMDIAPTVLEAAGLASPKSFEARSLWPILKGEAADIRQEVWSELARDHIQTGAEYIVMRRDARWKIVYYLGEEQGELYDLAADPGELHNLWASPDHTELRDSLVHEVLVWQVRGAISGRQYNTLKPQQPMLI
jgi:arylsulfatase A-like enzyme